MCDAHAYASSSVLGGGRKDTTPDSSRGIGMTWGVGGGGVEERRGGWEVCGLPPARPFDSGSG